MNFKQYQMSFIITVRTQLKGKRKIQFEKEIEKLETSNAELLRRMIDEYFSKR
jgi:hypothetical protein